MEAYKKWVRRNKEYVHSLESLANVSCVLFFNYIEFMSVFEQYACRLVIGVHMIVLALCSLFLFLMVICINHVSFKLETILEKTGYKLCVDMNSRLLPFVTDC